ncbi:hypothetical protein EAO69_43090 [Streptomyces sp. me109]|uniref:hypothetical protein n=1 Tax=Streptomyces sp. me109 TaxID=1827853 RepID=UPI0011CD54DD|nr:hypothetical protein [Streptomyces sp. me109]TXS54872.1 hypothetical protein EAO69_43090 [Streptomyces sp. me109]
MLTSADKTQIENFVIKVRNAGSDEQRVRMMALSELSKVHRRINPQTNEPYAPTTNRSLITEYRNIIKAELGENAPVLDTFKYSAARVTEYRQHQQEQREERHHQRSHAKSEQ